MELILFDRDCIKPTRNNTNINKKNLSGLKYNYFVIRHTIISSIHLNDKMPPKHAIIENFLVNGCPFGQCSALA